MKKTLQIFLLVLLTGNSFAQSTTMFYDPEYSKKTEVQIMTGDSIPDNYIVMGISQLLRETAADSIETLSKSNLKFINRWARRFKCLTVFVDFKGNVGGNPNDEKKGTYSEKTITFYCLAKVLNVVNGL